MANYKNHNNGTKEKVLKFYLESNITKTAFNFNIPRSTLRSWIKSKEGRDIIAKIKIEKQSALVKATEDPQVVEVIDYNAEERFNSMAYTVCTLILQRIQEAIVKELDINTLTGALHSVHSVAQPGRSGSPQDQLGQFSSFVQNNFNSTTYERDNQQNP